MRPWRCGPLRRVKCPGMSWRFPAHVTPSPSMWRWSARGGIRLILGRAHLHGSALTLWLWVPSNFLHPLPPAADESFDSFGRGFGQFDVEYVTGVGQDGEVRVRNPLSHGHRVLRRH